MFGRNVKLKGIKTPPPLCATCGAELNNHRKTYCPGCATKREKAYRASLKEKGYWEKYNQKIQNGYEPTPQLVSKITLEVDA